MPKRAHELAWTVSIKPPAAQPAVQTRVVLPGGTWQFSLTAGIVALLALPIVGQLHGLEIRTIDAVWTCVGATLFAYKYDVYEEPRFDALSRLFLMLAMPVFANMACWVADFSLVNDSAAYLQNAGLVFTALLSLQSVATLTARGLLKLLMPQDA